MSGHSKWNNIKRKKEKTDAAKAKIFTKIGREISVIVKAGGPNPQENSKLKDAIAKAKAANVPNDNIERIIKKAAGDTSANNYEELIYEGYGPNGVAVVVETLTDNRNRTAAEMRHYFDKCHGNLGQSGSVMFMFDRKGMIVIEGEGLNEDTVMEDALDAGINNYTYFDHLYALPYRVQFNGIMVNLDLIETKNLDEPDYDWTIDEFVDLAKKATDNKHRKGPKNIFVAFLLQTILQHL